MKRITVFAISLLAPALLSACTPPQPAPVATLPVRSSTAAPEETTLPTVAAEVVTPGTVQVLEGPEINYQGIHFFLDPSIGTRVNVFDDALTIDGLTAHSTRFALTSEPYCTTWCLEIYPISEFEQAFGTFVFPPAGYRGGAAVIFTAQEKTLSSPYSSGSRALEAFGQNHYGVSNESLKYVFRGYDADKRYGIFVQIPVHAPGLPDTAPTMAAGGDPVSGILDYNTRAAESLNALSPADFAPKLDVLDALVLSIHVETH